MPIFEYQCKSCAHCFEYLILKNGVEPNTCPQCGKKTVEKLMSAACTPKGSQIGGCGPGGSAGFS